MEAMLAFGPLHSAGWLAGAAASALFSALWEGAVLAGCVFVCLRLLPKLSAAARSVVWMNVFLLLTVLQVLPLAIPHGTATAGGHAAAFELNVRWGFAIAGVWVVLSLLRAGQLVFSAVRLNGLARRATPIEAGELESLLRILAVGGKARSAQLCTSDEVERPSVYGFVRPRILLPPALLGRLTQAELRQVVVHEMEHLRRADDWTNLMQKLALVVFPLNPALVWVERRLCAERELACDDKVLSSSCGRKAYAICLTHLAEYRMLRRGVSLALGAWERQSELVRRVHRILRRPGQPMSARRTLALSSALIVAAGGCALGLSRSPAMVGFAEPAAVQPMQMAQLATTERRPATERRMAALDQSAMSSHAENPHAEMVKEMAMMPEPANRMAKFAPAAKPAARKAILRSKRRRVVPEQEAWVVMTAWSGDSMMPQMVFAVARTASAPEAATKPVAGVTPNAGVGTGSAPGKPTPATARRVAYAVRFPDGWLIVQI
jgi:beta-lactamase regulating signal transducer with metallopeptidase domain